MSAEEIKQFLMLVVMTNSITEFFVAVMAVVWPVISVRQ